MSTARSVLLVEDVPFLRHLAGAFLNGEPDLVVVATAENGTQALSAAQTWCPDLVVLDDELGGPPSGLELLPALRQACPRARIVVFAASADRRAALGAGADKHVDKAQPWTALVRALLPADG